MCQMNLGPNGIYAYQYNTCFIFHINTKVTSIVLCINSKFFYKNVKGVVFEDKFKALISPLKYFFLTMFTNPNFIIENTLLISTQQNLYFYA